METDRQGQSVTRGIALVLLVLCCFGVAGDDVPRVSFVRPPAFVSTDDLVDYQIRVPNHDDNRRLVVTAVDQADGLVVRSSEEDLPGANAPRTRWLRWRLPQGHLLLVAALYGVHGYVGRASTPVVVRGRYSDPEDPE